MGMTNSFMSAPTIPSLTEDIIIRAWDWFNALLKKDPRQSAGAFVLVEVMQPVSSLHPLTISPILIRLPTQCQLTRNLCSPHSHRRPLPAPQPGRAPRTDTSYSSAQGRSLARKPQTTSPCRLSRRRRSRFTQATRKRTIYPVSSNASTTCRR
jgi:hypothetical protein